MLNNNILYTNAYAMGAPSNSNAVFLQTAAPVYGASELVEGQAVLKLVAPLDVTAVELSVRAHGDRARGSPHVSAVAPVQLA